MFTSEVTVIEPGEAQLLTTTEAVNFQCGTSYSDEQAAMLIKRASSIIWKHVGHKFQKDTLSEVIRLDIQHGPVDPEDIPAVVMLDRSPVISLTSITNEWGRVISGTDLATYCHLKPITGELSRLPTPRMVSQSPILGNAMPRWRFPITVVYVAGYDFSDAIDGTVEDICLGIIQNCVGISGDARDNALAMEQIQRVASNQYFDHGRDGQQTMKLTADMRTDLMSYRRSALGGDSI